MFLGAYEHTLDDKSRLTLPAKYRGRFADGLVLTRGMDGCLNAYTREEFGRVVESWRSRLDPLSRGGRIMQRFYSSAAAEAVPDKQGRVIVPQALATSAGLEREIVIAGVLDHLEIWDRASWREHLKDVEGGAEDAAERLAAQHD